VKTIVVLFVFGLGGVLLAATFGAIIWSASYARRCQQAAATLARAIGWGVVSSPGSAPDTWWGGWVRPAEPGPNRRVAIRTVALRTGLADADIRARLSPYLRVVMEIPLPEPLHAGALRGLGDQGDALRSLVVRNPDRFGPEARRAIEGFIRTGYPTGLRGVTWRSKPGFRNLCIEDVDQATPALLPPQLLPGAKSFIQHDHPDPLLSAQEFGDLLRQMAEIAHALEQRR
jgi:hypothetical protein